MVRTDSTGCLHRTLIVGFLVDVGLNDELRIQLMQVQIAQEGWASPFSRRKDLP